jgi:hypothetical protein
MPPSTPIGFRLIAVVLAGVSLCACEQRSGLDQDALARQIRSLASLSAEAAFMIDEARAGHLKPSFISAHLEDLADDVANARHEIAKPAPHDLQRNQAAAQALARQLSDALKRT